MGSMVSKEMGVSFYSAFFFLPYILILIGMQLGAELLLDFLCFQARWF